VHDALERSGVLKVHALWHCEQNFWDPSKALCTAPEDTWVGQDDATVIESGSAVQSGSKRTDLKRAMANLVPPTMESLLEPRDWSVFVSQLTESNLLGEGTAAIVYQVHDGHDLVALKKFRLLGSSDEACKLCETFAREMATQRLIHHENVVAALEWVDTPHLCLITEFVSGENLALAIHGNDVKSPLGLTAMQKHAILVGIAAGLTAMHHGEVTQGDIKPANVMLEGVTRQANAGAAAGGAAAVASGSSSSVERIYKARLCDFGLARRVKQHGKTRATSQSGKLQGTLAYLAPEVLRRAGVGCNAEESSDEDEEAQLLRTRSVSSDER
jgi:serine/threonine protein kinase